MGTTKELIYLIRVLQNETETSYYAPPTLPSFAGLDIIGEWNNSYRLLLLSVASRSIHVLTVLCLRLRRSSIRLVVKKQVRTRSGSTILSISPCSTVHRNIEIWQDSRTIQESGVYFFLLLLLLLSSYRKQRNFRCSSTLFDTLRCVGAT